MAGRKATFNTRAFVALVVALDAPALAITGLAGGGPGGHEHGLMGSHLALGGLFIIFCTWHTWLNRRALAKYARHAAARLVPSREAAAAFALMALMTLLFVGHAMIHGQG